MKSNPSIYSQDIYSHRRVSTSVLLIKMPLCLPFHKLIGMQALHADLTAIKYYGMAQE